MSDNPPSIETNVVNHTPRFDQKTIAKATDFETLFGVYDNWISYLNTRGGILEVANISALRALVDTGDPGAGETLVVDEQLRKVASLGIDGTTTVQGGLYLYKAGLSTTDNDGSSANYDSDGIVEPTTATGRWVRLDGIDAIRARGNVLLRTIYNWLRIDLNTDKAVYKTDVALELMKRSTSSLIKLVSNGIVEFHSALQTFTADASTDVITCASHGFNDGDQVRVESAGTLPAGLSDTTLYYVISSTASTFKVSTTKGGSQVDITDAGTGTFYVTGLQDIKAKDGTFTGDVDIQGSTTAKDLTADGNFTVDSASALTATFTADTVGDTIDSVAHGLVNGDRVLFTTTGTLPAGLSTLTHYYVINKTDDDYQVALTEGGSAIDITDTGSGTHTWTEIRKAVIEGDLDVDQKITGKKVKMLVDLNVTAVAVNNTTTETTLYSYSLPANSLGKRGMAVVTVFIDDFEHDETTTLTIRFKYGSTTVGTISFSPADNTENQELKVVGTLVSNNSTSSQKSFLSCEGRDNISHVSYYDYGTASEDSTGNLTLSVTAQWGAADNVGLDKQVGFTELVKS